MRRTIQAPSHTCYSLFVLSRSNCTKKFLCLHPTTYRHAETLVSPIFTLPSHRFFHTLRALRGAMSRINRWPSLPITTGKPFVRGGCTYIVLALNIIGTYTCDNEGCWASTFSLRPFSCNHLSHLNVLGFTPALDSHIGLI